MPGVRHETSPIEGFYESGLLVASDRNQIQISFITAIKRGERGTNDCLGLTTLHISINLNLLAGESSKMYSAGLNLLWRVLNLKAGGKGNALLAHDVEENRHDTKA